MGVTNEDNNQQNGAIMVILAIIRNVISLAAEVECGALLYNTKELESLRKTLADMGHPKQATEIIKDN